MRVGYFNPKEDVGETRHPPPYTDGHLRVDTQLSKL
jgi:hypothetical protein